MTTRFLHLVMIYAGAFTCGLAASWIKFPLPWMFGAMIFTSAVRLLNRPVEIPLKTRQIGQVLVASSVGLSFTPEAVDTMSVLLIPMVGAALTTIALGFVVAASLMRMTGVDVVTAALAAIPIGPVESAVLARKHGVAPGPVVFAQTLRIMALVTFIPPMIVALDGRIKDPMAVLSSIPWTVSGALLLGGAGLIGATLARVVRLANPYFVGALGGAALAAALSFPLTAYPYPVLILAQIFLGVWLGAVFDRELLRQARSFIPGAAVASLLMITFCVLMGLGLAWLTGQPWQVMVLGTAPGSVTEMALTAKILQEGLAIVTAFHLVRVFIILPFSPVIIGTTDRLARRWGLIPR